MSPCLSAAPALQSEKNYSVLEGLEKIAWDAYCRLRDKTAPGAPWSREMPHNLAGPSGNLPMRLLLVGDEPGPHGYEARTATARPARLRC